MLRITAACFNTSGTKPAGLRWELSLQQNKAATQPPGHSSVSCSQHADRATGGGCALLWRPPHPICASLCLKHIIKACVSPWAEPGPAAVHLATSSLEVTWGQRQGREILLPSSCSALHPWFPPWCKRCHLASLGYLKVFCWGFSNCDLTQQTNDWTTAHLFYKCLLWYWTAESQMKSHWGRTDR